MNWSHQFSALELKKIDWGRCRRVFMMGVCKDGKIEIDENGLQILLLYKDYS